MTAPTKALRKATADASQLKPAARHNLATARRALQLALAAVWLLDAALQYQPYMFTNRFLTQTLGPAAQGNPGVVSTPMRWASHLIVGHLAVFNAGFATIQLAIAAGLLWRRTVKAALAVSIAWAVGVWWLGEGLGGVFAGASPIMGAPGAVVLYALVALLVWPGNDTSQQGSVSDHGALGRTGARLAWLTLWGALAYLFLLPANRAPRALPDAVAGAPSGQPAWLAALDHHLAAALAGPGVAASIALAVGCDLVAVSVFVPRLARVGTVAAAAIGAFIWVAQGLGGIFTGQGTDPNSGILLILISAAFWPLTRPTEGVATSGPAVREGKSLAGPTPPAFGIQTVLHLISSHASIAVRPRRYAGFGRHSREPEPRPNMQARHRRIGLLAAVALLVTGGAAAHEPTKASPAQQTNMTAMPAGSVMQGRMNMNAGPTASPAEPAVQPSQSARMICSSEIRRDVSSALSLRAEPRPRATWADHLYTCTYHLPSDPLVIAVKELKDDPAAHTYFELLRQHLAPTRPILGPANLGLPGYETPGGIVIFLKDNKTLEVDASAFPARLGPNHVSPSDFAYQIATDILGCWTGK